MRQFGLTAAAAFAILGAVTAAPAQQTVITNGGVTVKNADGTTTHVTSGGVVTTGTKSKLQKTPHVRTGAQNAVSITGNDRTSAANTKNGVVTVTGNDNKVTVTGMCRRLVVLGNGNTVYAEQVAEIKTVGNDNHITWGTSPNRDKRPRISQTGNDNVVSRAAKAVRR